MKRLSCMTYIIQVTVFNWVSVVWASPHEPPYGAPLTQTSGGLQFRPCYRVKVGTICTWGLTCTLLGWYAGQGGESDYTSYAV